MTGKWLGQQPQRQHSIKRTSILSVAAGCCLLLTCGGCVDIAARTAGSPITGEVPPDEGSAVAADSPDSKTPAVAKTAGEMTADETMADASAAESVASESVASESVASDSLPSAAATSSGVLPAPSSTDGFPDADEVGLATDSVAD